MIRVGIVGLGFGGAVHLPALQQLPGVKVVALGGRRPEKARQLADRASVEIGGTIDDVLAAELDAVTVALPPDLGADVAERALRLGLAVLAEKPLAGTLERAEALARLARGRTTAVGFELAELDCFRALKQELQNSGPVLSARISWRTRSYAHSNRKWSWKTDRSQHGGVMNLLGSHVLYLVEWLLGPLSRLTARYSYERTSAFAPMGATPAEDRALISATSESGIPIEIELDSAAESIGQRWEFVLPDGRCLLEEGRDIGALVLASESGKRPKALTTEPVKSGVDWRIEPFRRLASRFLCAAEDGLECQPDFGSGVRIQSLLSAAGRSSQEEGRALTLNTPLVLNAGEERKRRRDD